MKIGRQLRENFWTAKGIMQGCSLSLLLFNILTADLEEEMGKVKCEGVKLRDKKVYGLIYADDMIL